VQNEQKVIDRLLYAKVTAWLLCYLSPISYFTNCNQSVTLGKIEETTKMLVKTPHDVGALIRERRKQKGLDQQALARSVGVSRKWIVEVEQGKPGAALGLILRTLAELGISLEISPSTSSAKPKKAASSSHDLDALIDSLKRKNG
jgi:HTH-type transcriptional regulator/antitoxin HipB